MKLPEVKEQKPVPAIPQYIIEPVWEQFRALLPPRDAHVHPLGCHRSRILDRLVFDKLVQVLVFGCAYERISDESCSATTLRRRRDEWIGSGAMEKLRGMALEAYDRICGLQLSEVAVDRCITKAPCGGEMAGRSPVDRGKRGLKRSAVVDANGIPLGAIAAPANRHDSPLLEETLDTLGKLGPWPERINVHLDRGYDSGKKVKGRKRHLLVDTEGLVLEAKVHGAGVFDRDGIKPLLDGVRVQFPRLAHLWLDAGYNGQGKGKEWVEKALGLVAEVVRHPPKPRYVWMPEGEEPDWEDLRRRGLLPKPGFRVLPRRWVVEMSQPQCRCTCSFPDHPGSRATPLFMYCPA